MIAAAARTLNSSCGRAIQLKIWIGSAVKGPRIVGLNEMYVSAPTA